MIQSIVKWTVNISRQTPWNAFSNVTAGATNTAEIPIRKVLKVISAKRQAGEKVFYDIFGIVSKVCF